MRETIVKLLNEVAAANNITVDLREGSPMYIYLVDVLAATLPALLEDIAAAGVMDVNERADNFYVTDGEATPSEFTVRVYFTAPTSLQYASNQMIFNAGGLEYSNKYSISWPSVNMSFYTDGVYYYHDIVLEGDSTISAGTDLVLYAPPSTYSHVVISSISNPGSAAFTDEQLEAAIRRELALRNNTTNPGIEAYMSDLYGSRLRDVLAQGFLDPEMQRDIYAVPLPAPSTDTTDVHMGGCVDVYMKGAGSTQKLLKFDNVVDTDTEMTGGYTILTSYTLPHVGLTSFYLRSWNRIVPAPPLYTTFTDGVDYTVGLASGIVTLLGFRAGTKHDDPAPPGPYNIMSGDFVDGDVAGGFAGGVVNRTVTLDGALAVEDYVNEGHIIQAIDDKGAILGNYIVNAVLDSGSGNSFTVDSTIVVTDGDPMVPSALLYLRYLEPVRCVYTYNPLGCKLEDFDNPVLSLDSINVLDPLTDEETDISVTAMPGFGYGHFGYGGFGVGEYFGYFLHSFDSNLRYSMRETGFLEIPRQDEDGNIFENERLGVNYHTDELIPAAHTDILANRPRPANMLAFAFVPAITDIDVRIKSPQDISEAAIIDMFWGMPGQIELSDIIDGFYNLGATYVNIGDLFTRSTYTVWSKDGILSRVTPTSDGKITLNSIIERFLPRSVTLTYED